MFFYETQYTKRDLG